MKNDLRCDTNISVVNGLGPFLPSIHCSALLTFYPEDGGNTLLRNFRIELVD
jgi:hypothetical protein